MPVALIAGGDGTSTSALTTSLAAGLSASAGVFISANYAAPVGASVGGSVGGSTSQGCAIASRFSGFSVNSTHRQYVGLQDQDDLTADHYYIQYFFTASHLRDYAEVHKLIAAVDTRLTPAVGPMADVAAQRVYFKRGKLTTLDVAMFRWVDNELQLFMHDDDEGDGLPMAKWIDASITTPGYCGVYLGTDSNGTWDDIYTGTFAIKWCDDSGSDAAAGTKSAPWQTPRYGIGNMDAGGVLFLRTQTYSNNVTDAHTSGQGWKKGTNWYNPSVVAAYNNETVLFNYTGGLPTLNFGGHTPRRLANAYICAMNIKIDGQDLHEQPGVIFTSGSSGIRLYMIESYQHGRPGGVAAVGFQDSYTGDTNDGGRLSDYDVFLIGCIGRDNSLTHGFYFKRSGHRTEFGDAHENGENGVQYQPLPAADLSRGQNNVIRHMRIWGNGIEPGVGGTAGIYIAYQTGLKCYNNLVYHNVHFGIRLSSFYTQGNGNDGCLVYHNVAWKNGYSGIDTEYEQSGGYTKPINNKIRNNVSFGNGTISPPPGLPAPTNAVRMSGTMLQSATNEATNNYLLDPGFANADNANRALADFSLTSENSPVVDSGSPSVSGVVAVDFLGFPRPSQNGYDIGAHEWVAALDASGNPIITGPASLTTGKNQNVSLAPFQIEHLADPGNYTVRVVMHAGTATTGV